jgi:hypothetical protein
VSDAVKVKRLKLIPHDGVASPPIDLIAPTERLVHDHRHEPQVPPHESGFPCRRERRDG